jgi:hypothetical protein
MSDNSGRHRSVLGRKELFDQPSQQKIDKTQTTRKIQYDEIENVKA